MSVVSLTNPGLIPMEAVTTMGVSAKEGENPIGVFGTCLKYAVASLLRTSQRITIWRGLERFDFAVEPGEVRGKAFQFIRMTGPAGEERLGFTTHLGAHWEMWQVFRELYSNCLDEAGEMVEGFADPAEGQTTIWVEGYAFAAAARDKNKYFLSTQPLHKGSFAEVHPGPSSGIYYRGVLVAKLERPSVHTYNLTTSMALTEDRTIKEEWYARHWVGWTLAQADDKAVIAAALQSKNSFEGMLSYDSPGTTFAETALELCERLGTGAVLPQAVRSSELWAQREARGTVLTLSDTEQEDVDDAVRFLADIGYPVSAPIVCVETLGPDVFGLAKNETIFLSRLTLNRGGNFLIGTILEEHLHLTQGFEDESRRFQDFLIDLVIKFARDAMRARQGRPSPPAFAPKPQPAAEAVEMPF